MPDVGFYSKEENKPKQQTGIVFVEPSGAGAFHIGSFGNIADDEIAYISSETIKAYNIKTGDELFCSVYINTDNEKVVREVLTINGEKIDRSKDKERVWIMSDSTLTYVLDQTKQSMTK